MKYTELKSGEVYVVKRNSTNYYILLNNVGNFHRPFINVNKKFFNLHFSMSRLYEYTIATQEEREWLMACIAAERWVEREQKSLSYDIF